MFEWAIAMTAVWAGAPTQLRPVVATPSVVERFTAWSAGRLSGGPPLCQPLPVPELQLCFRVWEGQTRRWVTETDRERWSVGSDALVAAVRSNCVEFLRAARARTIDGGTARYLVLTDGDGAATAGILCPLALRDRLAELRVTTNATFRAALPTQDVLLAWASGDPDLDRIMAVAVREIHDRQAHALTPQIVHFDGERWRSFGRAVPRR